VAGLNASSNLAEIRGVGLAGILASLSLGIRAYKTKNVILYEKNISNSVLARKKQDNIRGTEYDFHI
jgi:hypothetical protein